MSQHDCPTIRLGPIHKHPNADSLGIVHVDGWQCVVRLSDWKEGDLAVYIPPDYLVDRSRKEFSFLKDARIRVMRLRGERSEGLLVPAPEGLTEGDNGMESLGVMRYEPPMRVAKGITLGGNEVRGPKLYPAKYDIESWQKWQDVIAPGTQVAITEKLHGANARYVWDGETFYCGSRSRWLEHDGKNLWSQAVLQCPTIEGWCRGNPNSILYGEVYGNVQDLTYGAKPGEIRFAAFDVWRGGTFLSFDEALVTVVTSGVPTVPLLYDGAMPSVEFLRELAESDSRFGGIREGIVIQPMTETSHPKLGRVKLKLVSDQYLTRKE